MKSSLGTKSSFVMSRTLSVPPRLLQPLHVDTDINYSLDMSKFPGLDDPKYMYQPALLIASNNVEAAIHSNNPSTIRTVNPIQFGSSSPVHCSNPMEDIPVSKPARPSGVEHPSKHPSKGTSKELIEDLLNIIDSCSTELLDRLGDPTSSSHGVESRHPRERTVFHKNTSPMDAPYLPRNVLEASDKTCLQDYYCGFQYPPHITNTWNRRQQFPPHTSYVQAVHSNMNPSIVSNRQSNPHQPSVPQIPEFLSNLASLCTRNNVSLKRKTPFDACESESRKRQCSGVESIPGYPRIYPRHALHQPMFNMVA